MRELHKRDSETSGRKATRSVWVRCLESTRKLHRFQRGFGLGAAVYLHIFGHSLLRQRTPKGNRYMASPIRHEVAIPCRTQAVQCPRLTAHGIEEAVEVIPPSPRQLNSQRFEVEVSEGFGNIILNLVIFEASQRKNSARHWHTTLGILTPRSSVACSLGEPVQDEWRL